MEKVPTFVTERLVLRELVESDIPRYQSLFVDYDVIRNLAAGVPWPYPENGVREYLEAQVFPHQGKSKWVWAINLKEDPDSLIGTLDLWRIPSPSNRGFWLGKPFWGRGYMTEAVEPVNDFAFGTLGFEKLYFTNATSNNRSSRIKEKTGARLVERGPGNYVDPTFTLQDRYELTRERWEEYKAERASGGSR
jgi:[ribosomal protein S5]-alanine N-acetyltransferase